MIVGVFKVLSDTIECWQCFVGLPIFFIFCQSIKSKIVYLGSWGRYGSPFLPSVIYLWSGLNCRVVVAGTDFCMGHWVTIAILRRAREGRSPIISKSWESLHTPPTYKGLYGAICSKKINKTSTERLDNGLATARAVLRGVDHGVRRGFKSGLCHHYQWDLTSLPQLLQQ